VHGDVALAGVRQDELEERTSMRDSKAVTRRFLSSLTFHFLAHPNLSSKRHSKDKGVRNPTTISASLNIINRI
jgi:hypothetical protein